MPLLRVNYYYELFLLELNNYLNYVELARKKIGELEIKENDDLEDRKREIGQRLRDYIIGDDAH